MIKKSVAALLFLFVFENCKKNDDQVPNVHVDFYVYLNQSAYLTLNHVGNYLYLNGGNKGIILHRRDTENFSAYDRTCPYDPFETQALIEVDSSGLELLDRHCGSKFNILNGAVVKGPASRSLKQYVADFDGGSVVHVHN